MAAAKLASMRCLRSVLPFLLLAAVTFAAYWNAWPDALVQDDRVFAGQERLADLSLLPEFFQESLWARIFPEDSGFDLLYRPLLQISLAIDAKLFEDRAAVWHLVNVLLHVLATLLVYLLILQLLRLRDPNSESVWLVALLAAMVFGVHPIHTEVVNSIFNRSILLVAIGSTAGLWWLLRYLDSRPALAWTGIWLAYWFVLFSRESGIVLPALAVALVWINSRGGWWDKARRCLPVVSMVVPLLVYLAMRARAIAAVPQAEDYTGGLLAFTDLIPSLSHQEWSSLPRLAGVWLDALRLVLWPRPLLLDHPPPDPALQFAGLFVHPGLIVVAYYLYRRNRFGPITGLAIFYIALLPASRLFGSENVGPNLFERFLYEPSVGLAILLAFGLRYLLRRGDRLLASAPVVLAVCLLTPLTWARNAQWASDLALFEHDYRHGVREARPLRMFTAQLLQEGNFARAAEVCREYDKLPWKSGFVSLHCGAAYAKSGDPQGAEQAFLDATRDAVSRPPAYASLSYLYVAQGRPDAARDRLEKAIQSEANPATRAYLSGLLLLRLYPHDRVRLLEARAHFEEALRQQPRFAFASSALQNVNRNLELLQ